MKKPIGNETGETSEAIRNVRRDRGKSLSEGKIGERKWRIFADGPRARRRIRYGDGDARILFDLFASTRMRERERDRDRNGISRLMEVHPRRGAEGTRYD